MRITGDALPPMPEAGADAGIGAMVPVVNGYNFDGDPVSLDIAASGKPTMVVFLAHWCPHCQAEVPRLVSLAQNGQIDGVDVVGRTQGPFYRRRVGRRLRAGAGH
mgnify:CR=1 FL=1